MADNAEDVKGRELQRLDREMIIEERRQLPALRDSGGETRYSRGGRHVARNSLCRSARRKPWTCGRVDRATVERKIRECLDGWQERLTGTRVDEARRALREILVGPLRLTPVGGTYRFEGEALIGRVLGEVGVPTFGTRPAGLGTASGERERAVALPEDWRAESSRREDARPGGLHKGCDPEISGIAA